MTNATDALLNDLHLIASQGETPDGDGVTVNVQLWAERWVERLATPAGSASGEGGDGLANCAECGAFLEHVRPGKHQHPTCSHVEGALQAEVARLEGKAQSYLTAGCEAERRLLAQLETAEAEAARLREQWPLWRNRWVSDRTSRICEVDCVSYEMARAQAESEAIEYEATFNAATERLAMGSANGQAEHEANGYVEDGNLKTRALSTEAARRVLRVPYSYSVSVDQMRWQKEPKE